MFGFAFLDAKKVISDYSIVRLENKCTEKGQSTKKKGRYTDITKKIDF